MNRREVLQRAAWLMSGAVAVPVLGALHGCSRKPDAIAPLTLDSAQRAIIAEVAEIIIPRTDTPGAADVGVPAFIEAMLKDTFVSADQQSFVSGLEDFDATARRAHGAPFLKLPQAQRVALVQTVHDSAIEAAETRRQKRQEWKALEHDGALPVRQLRSLKKQLTSILKRDESPSQRVRPFILTMKELALLGFFSSQPGATQILQYLPVPGRLEACIALSEAGNGKTWALETPYRF